MKISILTQPLGHNYGGLLQAYALQKYLASIGHEIETLDFPRPPEDGLIAFKHYIKNLAKLMLGRNKSIPTNKRQQYAHHHLAVFRDQYINLSSTIHSETELLDYYLNNHFDAVIVGSDQVWRPRYSPCLSNFYLDFLYDVNSSAKRISYAASFGVSEWEYTPEETIICKELIAKFDAVSVREVSAQDLCQQYFGVMPKCLIDPTLLLDMDDYRQLFEKESSNESKGKVLTYILDAHGEKQQLAHTVAEHLGSELYSFMPKKITEVQPWQQHVCQYPKVQAWLQSFAEADFVVTDSFHGSIFSLIFHKPFIAVANEVRGYARFQSLLAMFGLESRLVYSAEVLDKRMLTKKIDWDKINHIRYEQNEVAKSFLQTSLNEDL